MPGVQIHTKRSTRKAIDKRYLSKRHRRLFPGAVCAVRVKRRGSSRQTRGFHETEKTLVTRQDSGSDSCEECASQEGVKRRRERSRRRGRGGKPLILRHARSQSIQFERQVFRHLTVDARAYIISTLSENVTSSRGRLNNTVGYGDNMKTICAIFICIALAGCQRATMPAPESASTDLDSQLQKAKATLADLLPEDMTISRAEVTDLPEGKGILLHASPNRPGTVHPSFALFLWPNNNPKNITYETGEGAHTFRRIGSSERFRVYHSGPSDSVMKSVQKQFCTEEKR